MGSVRSLAAQAYQLSLHSREIARETGMVGPTINQRHHQPFSGNEALDRARPIAIDIGKLSESGVADE